MLVIGNPELLRARLVAGRYEIFMKAVAVGILPRTESEDPVRIGGYLCVADGESGLPLFIAPVGHIETAERAKKYLEFCQEKAIRLALYPNHISSWQSRDVASKKYGGAVRARDLIISFSGLKEIDDESVSCFIAELLGKMDASELRAICEISAASQ